MGLLSRFPEAPIADPLGPVSWVVESDSNNGPNGLAYTFCFSSAWDHDPDLGEMYRVLVFLFLLFFFLLFFFPKTMPQTSYSLLFFYITASIAVLFFYLVNPYRYLYRLCYATKAWKQNHISCDLLKVLNSQLILRPW